MLQLEIAQIEELPVDELGLLILEDIHSSDVRDAHDYWLNYGNGNVYAGTAVPQAIQEALAWLMSRGLLVPDLDRHNLHSIAVSRAGKLAITEGIDRVRAEHRLAEGLHPEIERRARPQFLLGEYEQAIFVSLKAVEVRVRELSDLGDNVVGVDLINQAFGNDGVLVDGNAVTGEREGRRALFAGAYAVLRNPAGHRDVNYDNVAEAAEAVTTASLLMRILDSIEPAAS
ncbi:TIGR02391 family protein [Candidatus Poriferisocius sp.]|uniref:TIGR02391 family protein n=1 Tax=Candidatus Poriferisocius sp. TaxID=3101276 RepID=UPI003B5AFC95